VQDGFAATDIADGLESLNQSYFLGHRFQECQPPV
jgi:hypothetical protein